jgi:hypothetical protein
VNGYVRGYVDQPSFGAEVRVPHAFANVADLEASVGERGRRLTSITVVAPAFRPVTANMPDVPLAVPQSPVTR